MYRFSHNSLRHRDAQTYGLDRQTDDSIMPTANHTACSSTVQSAKKHINEK